MINSNTIHKLLENSEDIKINNLNDLNLTVKDLSDSVIIIRAWFRQQPHLSDIVPDLRLMENIYIGCKGSIERTKSCLDMFYTLKTAVPEIFNDRDPLYPGIHEATESMVMGYSPILTENKSRIYFGQFLDKDKFNLVNILKRTFMAYELKTLYDEGNTIIGVIDISGMKMGHVMQVTPFMIKIAVKFFLEALVARVKGIHVINPPSYAHTMIELIKSFLSPKIRSRVFSHKTLDDLHKVIGKKYLPKDFGGDLRQLKEIQDDWSQVLVEHRDYFLAGDKQKTVESRRPGKPVINELLGIHGSFRKLDVD